MSLNDKIKKLPSAPGVYLMKDATGGIIYIGKSKNLKARVQSYFHSSNQHSPKTKKLVSHLKDFEYIVTDTEIEALLLECKLIKKWKPIYNRLLKRHQAYTYIVINKARIPGRLGTASSIYENDNCLYFGPFSNKYKVESVLQSLKRFLKIDCNSHSRNSPCLNYSLNFCLGHCFQSEKMPEYHHSIDRITDLFLEKDTGILNEMEAEMNRAAELFDFKKAAELRDTIASIRSLLRKEKVAQFTKDNKNIVVMEAIGAGNIKLFFIQRNKIIFHKKIELTGKGSENTLPDMLEDVLHYFQNSSEPSGLVKKEEIDQSQIIYSYLKSNACNFALINEPLLKPENRKKLKKILADLLNKETVKAKQQFSN